MNDKETNLNKNGLRSRRGVMMQKSYVNMIEIRWKIHLDILGLENFMNLKINIDDIILKRLK